MSPLRCQFTEHASRFKDSGLERREPLIKAFCDAKLDRFRFDPAGGFVPFLDYDRNGSRSRSVTPSAFDGSQNPSQSLTAGALLIRQVTEFILGDSGCQQG